MDVVATQLLSQAEVPEDKSTILTSLFALLDSLDLEVAELEENQQRQDNFRRQMASLEAQRSEVNAFVHSQRKNHTRETVSRYLTNTFAELIKIEDNSITERNDRFLGLYRSAAASIMKRNWPDDLPVTVDWVESFNRIVERRVKAVRTTAKGYSKVSQIFYLGHLMIPEDIYRSPGLQCAPKEYWLQYASFNLIGSVLASNKFTMQLREDMAPALEILNLAIGK